MIRTADSSDIPYMVKIHTTSLPDDLMPRIGLSYLNNQFYPIVLSSENAYTLVYENQEVQAFVIFTYNSKTFSKELTKNKFALGCAILNQLPRDPLLIRDILFASIGKRTIFRQSIKRYPDSFAELFLIATHPSQQSKGIGRLIVREGLKHLKAKGIPICLVKTSSEKARSFYDHLGFFEIGIEYRGPRQLSILIHNSDKEKNLDIDEREKTQNTHPAGF